MILPNFNQMSLDDYRLYVLKYRGDSVAFQTYVDRSKAEGRMISFSSADENWEEALNQKMCSYHPQEKDYWNEPIEVENSTGEKQHLKAGLLRVYPETFNGYDAYLDIRQSDNSDIKKVISPRLNKKWEVIFGPVSATVRGYAQDEYTENNPPAWVFGLRLLPGEIS